MQCGRCSIPDVRYQVGGTTELSGISAVQTQSTKLSGTARGDGLLIEYRNYNDPRQLTASR